MKDIGGRSPHGKSLYSMLLDLASPKVGGDTNLFWPDQKDPLNSTRAESKLMVRSIWYKFCAQLGH